MRRTTVLAWALAGSTALAGCADGLVTPQGAIGVDDADPSTNTTDPTGWLTIECPKSVILVGESMHCKAWYHTLAGNKYDRTSSSIWTHTVGILSLNGYNMPVTGTAPGSGTLYAQYWVSSWPSGYVYAQRAITVVDPATSGTDDFNTNSLGQYTIHNTPHAWSISGGRLHASTAAQQSVVIRNGLSMTNGWVETETDNVSDGGLVLRFQSSGNYYLLAIRDDTHFGWANLEVYRAQGGAFTRIGGPMDIYFARGLKRKIKFEASGQWLRVYVDDLVHMTVNDATYTSGGAGLRHDNTRGWAGITSHFDVFRWGAI
jgi:hypothetical protein